MNLVGDGFKVEDNAVAQYAVAQLFDVLWYNVIAAVDESEGFGDLLESDAGARAGTVLDVARRFAWYD